MKIIDGRVRLRTEQLLKAWTTELKPYFKEYIHWYKMKDRLTPIPIEEQIKHIKQQDIEKIVVCGGDKEENDHIIQLAEEHDEIIPVAGVNITNGILSALTEIQRCCKKNVAAINLSPFMEKVKEQLNQETQDILQECLKEVENLLKKESKLLDRFAQELLAREELNYDEIEAIFQEFGFKRKQPIK